MKYKRVLIKLSGEALKDVKDDQILDSKLLNTISLAIKEISDLGVQVCIVCGAGNIWRGRLADKIGIEHATADYMGMLGTIINALAIGSSLEKVGLQTRVMSSLEIVRVAEPYIQKRAIRHLEKGRVVIFAGGIGNPYFTTDTTAALRAKEVHCDAILMAKNGVEGVYDSDPRTNKNAKLIKDISYDEVLKRNLQVIDSTAISLLRDSNIVTRVFDMGDKENFVKICKDEPIGTTIK